MLVKEIIPTHLKTTPSIITECKESVINDDYFVGPQRILLLIDRFVRCTDPIKRRQYTITLRFMVTFDYFNSTCINS